MSLRFLGGLAAWLGAMVLLTAILASDQLLGRPTVLIDRWFFAAAGLAVLTFGICLRQGATAFGLLAFFLIIGGAAQLYVTGPARLPSVHLVPQNWKEWATVCLLAGEALVAVTVLMTLGAENVLSATRRRLGIGRIGAFVLLTAILFVPIQIYVHHSTSVSYFAHVFLALMVTLVHFSVFAAMSQVTSPISGLYRLSPLVPAAITLVVSLVLCFVAFERMPHTEDEFAFLFQAKTFAGAALSAPAPPEAAMAGLSYPMIDLENGQWFAATQPGWPALLAAGIAVGAPWLINPLLAALSVLMAHAITSRLAGRDHADMVAMMMGASPWLLMMAASLLPHTLALALMLFAILQILRAGDSEEGALRRLFMAGLAMGWLFAARPLDGLAVGGLVGIWLMFLAPMGGIGRGIIYALGLGLTALLLLFYNSALTGSALTQPIALYVEEIWGFGANGFGFGAPTSLIDIDIWPGQSLGEGLLNFVNLTANLQLDFMGWSVGSLALILCYLIWQKPERTDIAMIVLALTVGGMALFYWSADSYFIGPRQWFLASFPLFFLSARGFQAIRERFPDHDGRAFVRVDALFWYACLFGLCVFLPWRAVTKYYEFGGYHSTVRTEAQAGQFEDKLVLVTQAGNPGSVLMLNDPWLRGTVFLNDTGTLDEEALRQAFPDKEIVYHRSAWE
ncbi:MAG: hypothetical protein WBA91_06600 [Paracoccaceae bacterium]